jgi:hypothetical protein
LKPSSMINITDIGGSGYRINFNLYTVFKK